LSARPYKLFQITQQEDSFMKCAVFASGGGSNFQALLDRRDAGDLHVDFALVIGNNSKAYAFERARKHNIPTLHCAPSHFDNQADYTAKLLDVLRQHEIDLIILAGYMKMIPDEVTSAYHNRMVNIHPALLPAFGGKGMYGKHVHQAVLDYGAKVTGVTVHFVDAEYDRGPIILQRTIDVLDNDSADTLAQRVLAVEHDSLWRAIEAIAQGTISVEGRRVFGKA
jgi:phosphoribosylglycinamide formyltransferase-1